MVADDGADIVDGGAGSDSVKIDELFAHATVTKYDDGRFEITTPAGTASVKNVETFQFLDKTLSVADLARDFDRIVLTDKQRR